ncbi:SCO4651 family lipoprotein [Streptacidiphilus sp. PAMC 29251]
MRHTRALCMVAGATLGLAALTSCTAASKAGGTATGAAKSAVVSVADAMSLTTQQTAKYTSMKMKMTEVMPKVGTSTATGVMSRDPLAMRMTMSNPQLTSELGSSSIQMMMTGSTMYMNLGSSGAKEFGGKHWVKMDFTALGAQGKALSSAMNKSNGQDPSDAIKLLTTSGDIKKVGQETVDGVPTTHYAGTVDMKKLATQEAGADSGLKTIIDQAGQLGMTTEKVDLWVDSRSLPVKVHETATSNQGPIDITVEYSDFGTTPVKVTPPPAADTVDFATLLKQAKSS